MYWTRCIVMCLSFIDVFFMYLSFIDVLDKMYCILMC